MTKIKTGKELLDSFFENLKSESKYDSSIVSVLTNLYETGKLTNSSIANELDTLRKNILNEDQKDSPTEF